MKKDNVIYKDQFIRLLAQESGFTITDIRIIWNTIEKIFLRALLSDKEIALGGFGKLYVKHVPPHESYDAVHKTWYMSGPINKVYFRVSYKLKNALKRYAEENVIDFDEFENEDEEEE